MLKAPGEIPGLFVWGASKQSHRLICCNMAEMKHVLFVCSRNKLRSPTAENVFYDHPNAAIASAGTNHDADTPLTADLVAWANIIFVMERSHRAKLSSRFRSELKDTQVVCLDIPDKFAFMDATLIRILKAKVTRYLA